ncbi:MAG: macrolide family glycosyltransferase [Vicinamibacterales bacterium]
MARIVYVGVPAHGHTNPTIGVVKRLVARGHEVLYYNAEPFRPKLAGTGVEFHAYPEPMPTEREISEALYEFVNASLLFSRLSRHLTGAILDEMRRLRPDLILYDSAAMWGYVAGRALAIRHVALFTHFVLGGALRTIGLRPLARFLRTALPHLPELVGWRREMTRRFGRGIAGGLTEYGDGNLVFTSRQFHPQSAILDNPRFRFVGASFEAGRPEDARPLGIQQGERVVYVSLGTVNSLDPTFYRAAFEAFADHPGRVVLSAGTHTDLGALAPWPANFVVAPFVPQLAVLACADAFVTHGGLNSVHEALVHGVPMVVVPHQLEQLLNGRRVAVTGTGVLRGGTPPYGRVTATGLRDALAQILGDPRYGVNAARFGKTLIDAGGPARAADYIEDQLSRSRQAGA